MKTGKKLLTGTLLALCAALLVLCSVLAIGWSKAAKTNTALPEVRNNGTAIQWKYSDEADWRDLVALTELRGAAGENGKNGTNGKDGVDGKNGIDGIDGKNGADGKNGINGTNGKDGINGVDGKDGADGKNGKDGIDGANGKDGADGKDGINGTDGINGVDGKDGINAKNIEVQRAETHIQWRYEGDEWQNLVAIADITGPTGQKGADGANGKTPEFRVSENTLQWRYVGDEIWLNLYDLSVLKGLDGKDGADGINGKDGADGKDGTNGINGQDGRDGADGNTPFIGENGNWWIGETDTGVKAAGIDGEKGDKGDKGDKGQNGSCAGWFYGTLWTKGDLYKEDGAERPVGIKVYKEAESGGFVSTYMDEIYLKKGHTYSVTISASMELQSHEDRSGNYSVQMTDNYDDGFCREATRIKRDGVKLPYSRDQHHFSFSRIYIASDEDIPLRFKIEQSSYKTTLLGFNGTITITALD